jgi:hypothetical protein
MILMITIVAVTVIIKLTLVTIIQELIITVVIVFVDKIKGTGTSDDYNDYNGYDNDQCCGSAFRVGFRIRIRIQHFLSMRIRFRIQIQIQGFDDKKSENIYN